MCVFILILVSEMEIMCDILKLIFKKIRYGSDGHQEEQWTIQCLDLEVKADQAMDTKTISARINKKINWENVLLKHWHRPRWSFIISFFFYIFEPVICSCCSTRLLQSKLPSPPQTKICIIFLQALKDLSLPEF